jgi:hypothetical protein
MHVYSQLVETISQYLLTSEAGILCAWKFRRATYSEDAVPSGILSAETGRKIQVSRASQNLERLSLETGYGHIRRNVQCNSND